MARASILVLLVATLACSRVQLAYPWLDWVLEAEARSYLALTVGQRGDSAAAIDDYLGWHRRQLLPRYAAFLRDQAAACASAPMTSTQLAVAEAALKDLYRQTMRRPLGIIADLLVAQSPTQIDHLERALADRQEERAVEAAQPTDERLARASARYSDWLEEWVGELTEAQRAILIAGVHELHRDPAPWLAERARRNAMTIAVLRRGVSRAELTTYLDAWWLGEPDPSVSAAALAYQRHFAATLRRMTYDLLTTLDPSQRRHLAGRMQRLAADFDELARG